MRLIDADALKKQFPENIGVGLWHFTGVWAVIANAPTIEAEPVRHGRWETDKEDIVWGNSLKRKHCTNCGKRPHFDKESRKFILTNYCHHCGAKMDGDSRAGD